jgi:transketolase
MFSVAAGLAAAGKIPFCSTFAKFVVRGYDQIEMAINSGANFKIVGTHAGITLAADGPSQMSLPDCAFFRSFAHVKNYHGETAVRYFYPSDAISAYRQLELMANFSGCGYLRALRADTKTLYKPDDQFEVGGYKVLREGKDGIFIAAGYMVHECLKASDDLAKSGRKFGVVDAYSMPLKDHSLVEVIRKNGNYAITVEDNYTGGLDAEVATLLALSGSGARYKHLFVRNIPKSGREPQDVLAYCNLDAASIVKSV